MDEDEDELRRLMQDSEDDDNEREDTLAYEQDNEPEEDQLEGHHLDGVRLWIPYVAILIEMLRWWWKKRSRRPRVNAT